MTTLAAFSTEGLLTTFAALTHRIHATERIATPDTGYGRKNLAKAADLRAQRDLVKTEILRRTGDLPTEGE